MDQTVVADEPYTLPAPLSLPQLDGNDSSDTSSLESASETFAHPDEQCSDQFSALPKIYSANARSIFSKYDDFIEKLTNHRIDAAQISETWQDTTKDDITAKDRNIIYTAKDDSCSDYMKRISEVSHEIANEEFSKRKNKYEKLVKEKEIAEIHLRTSIKEVAVDSSKLQKHEEDIQIWRNSIFNTNQKIEFLDEEIRQLDEKLQDLKRKRHELNLDKRSFEGIIQEKSEKSLILTQHIEQGKDEIEKSRQKIAKIKVDMEEVLKPRVSATDPLLTHLDKQISQKSLELECPVCFTVCQPPILRCPLYHVVCSECWPRLRVCGECRQLYQGKDRHRYAERTFQDLQDLIRTREDHVRNK